MAPMWSKLKITFHSVPCSNSWKLQLIIRDPDETLKRAFLWLVKGFKRIAPCLITFAIEGYEISCKKKSLGSNDFLALRDFWNSWTNNLIYRWIIAFIQYHFEESLSLYDLNFEI